MKGERRGGERREMRENIVEIRGEERIDSREERVGKRKGRGESKERRKERA